METIKVSPTKSSQDKASTFHKRLLQAIKMDDADKLSELLDNLDLKTSLKILHKNEDIQEDLSFSPWHCEDLSLQLCATKPVHLCVIYQSLKCFEKLFEMDAVIDVLDKRGNNVVHLLVYSIKHRPNEEACEKFYDSILEHCSDEMIKALLLQRSNDGLTPLELATKLQVFPLFRKILLTENIYCKKVDQQGKIIRYRFTFPECPSGLSFLWQLTWIQNTDESRKSIAQFLDVPIVQKLIHRKFTQKLPLIIVWFVCRLAFAMTFVSLDWLSKREYSQEVCDINGEVIRQMSYSEWYNNTDDQNLSNFFHLITAYTFCYTLLGFLIDISELIFFFKSLSVSGFFFTQQAKQGYFVNTTFYRVAVVVSTFLAFVREYLIYMNYIGNRDESVFILSSVVSVVHNVFISISVFYFFQLPYAFDFGQFMISFQHMIVSVIRFAFLQIMLMLNFESIFTMIKQSNCKPGPWTCYNNLSFSLEPVYNSFLVMINLGTVIPPNKECDGIADVLLKMMHILYVFIVAILTTNYLIAIMSSVYSRFADQGQNFVAIHRLHIALVLERRVEMLNILMSSICGKESKSPQKEEVIEVIEVEVD